MKNNLANFKSALKSGITTNTNNNNSNRIAINFSNTNENIKTLQNISKASDDLIGKLNPMESIENFMRNNYTLSPMEINKYRIFELNKYKLSMFLNRELQQEILFGGEFVSNKINNEIVSQKYSYTEEATNNLYLHKRVSDYFVLIHFKYLKPNKDKKRITKFSNEMIIEHEKKFGDHMGIFRKLTGADYNPDYQEAKLESMHDQGVNYVEDYYQDYTPYHFNINIINNKSETLQYRCYSQENQISVESIRYFNMLSTSQFYFLKDLKGSQDDWDNMKKDWRRNLNKNSKDIDADMDKEKSTSNNKFQSEEFSQGDQYSPDFYTLNRNLQGELINFLTHLEITPEINSFVRYLGLNRERREFIGWLYKLINFINN